MIKTNYFLKLCKKIKSQEALIGVIGIGYVGIQLLIQFNKAGIKTLGFDKDKIKISKLRKGISPYSYIDNKKIKSLKKLSSYSNNFNKINLCDIIIICLPTPIKKNTQPDLSAIEVTIDKIKSRIKKGQLIILESTTYPGTTREKIGRKLLNKFNIGKDIFLSYSPERVDPGNMRYTTKNTNKVVGGVGKKSLNVAKTFYNETIDHVVPVSSAKIAEMVKVYENTYRAVNIALVNEMMLLCDRMEINVWEMLEAAFTKPFGISPFFPGPGVGGHCIPLDPHYLEWKAREYDFKTRFIELAGDINRSMPQFVYQKIIRLLNSNKKTLSNARILVVGMAYKSNLPDYRESPSLEIFKLLYKDCKMVEYHDNYVKSIELNEKILKSTNLTKLGLYDLIVITTGHSYINYKKIIKNSQLILDTRNATKNIPHKGNVVLL